MHKRSRLGLGKYNFGKKKVLSLTEKELKLHEDATQCYIFRKKFTQKLAKDKNHQKIRDHGHLSGKYRRTAHSICNPRFNVHNKIPVVFHNGSKYDYYFIKNELANKFKGKFECLGENIGNYKTFSFPIEKEIKNIDEDGNEDITTVSYKIKFIDSARFMASSLSNLVVNLGEGIQKIDQKNWNCCLEYKSVKDNLIKCSVYVVIKTIQTRLMKK